MAAEAGADVVVLHLDGTSARWLILGVAAVFQDVDLAGLEPVSLLLAAGGAPVPVTATLAGVPAALVPTGRAAAVVIAVDADTAVGLSDPVSAPLALVAPVPPGQGRA